MFEGPPAAASGFAGRSRGAAVAAPKRRNGGAPGGCPRFDLITYAMGCLGESSSDADFMFVNDPETSCEWLFGQAGDGRTQSLEYMICVLLTETKNDDAGMSRGRVGLDI